MNTPAPRIALHASPSYALALAVAHGLAALGAVLVLPAAAAAFVAFGLALLCVRLVLERALLRTARSPAALVLLPEDRLRLERRDGLSEESPVALRRFVTGWAVILPVGRGLVVPADMCGEAAHRRLRLWSLWGQAQPGTAGRRP